MIKFSLFPYIYFHQKTWPAPSELGLEVAQFLQYFKIYFPFKNHITEAQASELSIPLNQTPPTFHPCVSLSQN